MATKRICVALALLSSLGAPAMALRDSAQGTIVKSDPTEVVVRFGDEKNTDKKLSSGLCTMHRGVLTVRPDGYALFDAEVSSPDTTSTWRGDFVILDKEAQVLTTLPTSGAFTIEIKGLSPRKVSMLIPMSFSPDVFRRIDSVKMAMEC
jgi:hypothetical protein